MREYAQQGIHISPGKALITICSAAWCKCPRELTPEGTIADILRMIGLSYDLTGPGLTPVESDQDTKDTLSSIHTQDMVPYQNTTGNYGCLYT